MPMPTQPNILLVMTDQQRADFLQAQGFALDTMPFLEELSRRGVWFDSAYTPMPICTPARISLLTGRYPKAHGMIANWSPITARYVEDLPQTLRQQGYQLALFGKNHSHVTADRFDVWQEYSHTSGPVRPGHEEEDAAFDHWMEQVGHWVSPVATPFPVESQYPARIASDFLQWLDARQDPRPFFAWISFPEPHSPYQVPQPYFDLFPPAAVPPPAAGPEALSQKNFQWQYQYRAIKHYHPECDTVWPRYRANYCGMLRLIDDQLRRLVAALEAHGLLENTIVVYLSDHGDFCGDYGLYRKGLGLPQCTIRVPMLWLGGPIQPLAGSQPTHASAAASSTPPDAGSHLTHASPADSPGHPQPSNQPAEASPADSPGHRQPSNQPAEASPADSATHPQPSNQPAEASPADSPGHPQPSNQPAHVSAAASSTPPDAGSHLTHASPADSPVHPQPSNQPAEASPADSPAHPQPSNQPAYVSAAASATHPDAGSHLTHASPADSATRLDAGSHLTHASPADNATRLDAGSHPAHVSLVDVYPTLCEAIGVPIPAGVQGRSLWPLLTGQPYDADEFASAYAEVGIGGLALTEDDDVAFGSPADTLFVDGQPRTNFDGTRVASSGYRRALVKGRWKLIVDTHYPLELYDLQADPHELHNLATSPAHAAIREELILDLLHWSIRLDDNAHVRRYTVKTAPPSRA